MSELTKLTLPCDGISAPAMHFIRVLLPEPLGPISPWNSFSPTVSVAPSSAVSLPKLLTIPVASRSGITSSLELGCKAADALTLIDHEADEAKRPKQDYHQKQNA